MKLETTIAILLISFSMVGAQNQYKLSDTNVWFFSTEQMDIVADKPGYAVFSNVGIRVSISQIRFLPVDGLAKGLENHFPKREYKITQTNYFADDNSKQGLFHFANRLGDSKRFAKGLIDYEDKTFLVEIVYDNSKDNEVKNIVNSIFAQKKEPNKDEYTYYYNTLQSAKDEKVEQDEDEYIQNYEYPKFSQVKESEIQMVEIEDQPKVKKHPKVEHPNLIKLTQLQKQEFIDAHNKWRAEVGVPPLTWNNDLENYAGEWAIKNGKKNCKMQHRSDTDYGENLYWSSGLPFSPKGAVDSWGSEIEDYNDELVGDEKAVVGHYTQIVWRTTTEVGCAAFQCGKALLVVCNYNPAGNWVGQHPYKK